MRLTTDTLYYHLSEHHSLEYKKSAKQTEPLRRPIFYTPHIEPEYHLVILTDPSVVVPPGTYLCFQKPKMKDPSSTRYLLLDKTEDPHRIFNELQGIYDFYDRWETTCLQNVERFQDYRSLIRYTYQTFKLPLCLVDSQFSVIASEHSSNTTFALFEDENRISSEAINDMINNPHFRNMEVTQGLCGFEYDKNYKLYNFHLGNEYLGRLIMGVLDSSYDEHEAMILSRLAEFVEILLLKFGSFQTLSTAQTYLHEFLSNSLSGKLPLSGDLTRLSENTKWEDTDQYLVVYFLPEHRLKKQLYPPYLISQAEERWKCSCAAEYHGNVVMLLNLTQFGPDKLLDFYQSLAYLVRDSLMIAGCSRTFSGLREISLALKQAKIAIDFGQKKNPTMWYFKFDDYGLEYLLQRGTGDFKPEQVCHPALLQLRKHDLVRQTSYYQTLFTYFECQFNMSLAASVLYIHRSTFINRMERILELTRLNLDKYDTRLYLELSFRLLQNPEEELNAQFYV